MTHAIELTPELAAQVQDAAQRAGLSPNTYVMQLIRRNIVPQTKQHSTTQLSQEESDLIQSINASLATDEWAKYRELIDKRDAERLTTEEHSVLLSLSDKVEALNVQRISAVAKLAMLRNTSIDALMDDMELKPRDCE